MKFEGSGIVIDRDKAIRTAIRMCVKVCGHGKTQIAAVDIADAIAAAMEEITPIAFICDRRACKNCSYPTCKHTFDINHAANFQISNLGICEEKERSETNE